MAQRDEGGGGNFNSLSLSDLVNQREKTITHGNHSPIQTLSGLNLGIQCTSTWIC